MTVLAGDLGGTRIKLGLVSDGRVLARRIEPARSDRPLRERLPDLEVSLRELCREAGLATGQLEGIGLAVPCVIDPRSGRVLDEWGKYPGCRGFDFPAWGKAAFGLPLALDNDARAALIGESRQGAARGCKDVAMLTLGTGLGSAALICGQILRGAHGQAGILGGHLTVRHDGRACVCGNRGCAEAEASSRVLADLARARPDFVASSLAREPELDFATVFRLAQAGDPCAQGLRDHCLSVWSAAGVNLLHAYDASHLILGGGIMAGAETVLPYVRRHVARHAHAPWGAVRVEPSQLGDEAALVGCEGLVRETLADGGASVP
jgi:glucokinase